MTDGKVFFPRSFFRVKAVPFSLPIKAADCRRKKVVNAERKRERETETDRQTYTDRQTENETERARQRENACFSTFQLDHHG